MGVLKILVADASPVYKKMFAQAVAELDRDITFDYAANGDDAFAKIKYFDYDVIVIDAEIAGIVELFGKIMLETPKTRVLLTARPSPANKKLCAEVLAKGAFDCMIKPIDSSYKDNLDVIKSTMTDVFHLLNEERGKPDMRPDAAPAKTEKTGKNIFRPEIVLIAASTGGPAALETVITKLRKDFPIPILVVQHMPPHFVETFARDLAHRSQLRVKVAEHRETVAAETVYIAPGGLHMKLDTENKIYFDGSPPINGLRPAADKLFESIAESFGGSGVLAVILTGMGCDGEKGIARLKEKRDCFCVAQSEKTCVVYGMPRAVVESGFADKILDLEKISVEIETLALGKS